ncbi:hypothetical protein L596_030724 [Steinernema carpocapsae]|uniref:Uncharacterized protein n=1 Tax=Steinernema carpocapsae TaxID=34508 RepID=A0A4U5LNK5_STECR|nr:hypothetical protein L596_030724 [Steinernema carpocapsae]
MVRFVSFILLLSLLMMSVSAYFTKSYTRKGYFDNGSPKVWFKTYSRVCNVDLVCNEKDECYTGEGQRFNGC